MAKGKPNGRLSTSKPTATVRDGSLNQTARSLFIWMMVGANAAVIAIAMLWIGVRAR